MIVQTYKARCGLEHQYRIERGGQAIGHILAVIGRKGVGWQVLTRVSLDGAEGFTLTAEGRTKTQAIRHRRRHLKEIPARIEQET